MKNWLIALGIALSIGWTCEADNPADAVVWEHVCTKQFRYSCGDVTPPRLVEEDAIFDAFRPKADGFYVLRSPNIYIRATLSYDDEAYRKAVLFHEMVHYLQWNLGPGESWGKDICEIEDESFELTDRYVGGYLNRPDLVVGKHWWQAYPYCYGWAMKNGRMAELKEEEDASST